MLSQYSAIKLGKNLYFEVPVIKKKTSVRDALREQVKERSFCVCYYCQYEAGSLRKYNN